MTADRPLQGKRILVLEDDYYAATDEKALLERAGATVVGPFGSSCGEGDIKDAGAVDAAVVDINLGSGPDFSFARLLQRRGTPFVFVTGYDAGAVPEDLSDVPRIEKPFLERQLLTTLTDLAAGVT